MNLDALATAIQDLHGINQAAAATLAANLVNMSDDQLADAMLAPPFGAADADVGKTMAARLKAVAVRITAERDNQAALAARVAREVQDTLAIPRPPSAHDIATEVERRVPSLKQIGSEVDGVVGRRVPGTDAITNALRPHLPVDHSTRITVLLVAAVLLLAGLGWILYKGVHADNLPSDVATGSELALVKGAVMGVNQDGQKVTVLTALKGINDDMVKADDLSDLAKTTDLSDLAKTTDLTGLATEATALRAATAAEATNAAMKAVYGYKTRARCKSTKDAKGCVAVPSVTKYRRAPSVADITRAVEKELDARDRAAAKSNKDAKAQPVSADAPPPATDDPSADAGGRANAVAVTVPSGDATVAVSP